MVLLKHHGLLTLHFNVLNWTMPKGWQVRQQSQLQRQTYQTELCGASPSLPGHTSVQLAKWTILIQWFPVEKHSFSAAFHDKLPRLEWCAGQISFVAFNPADPHLERPHRKHTEKLYHSDFGSKFILFKKIKQNKITEKTTITTPNLTIDCCHWFNECVTFRQWQQNLHGYKRLEQPNSDWG